MQKQILSRTPCRGGKEKRPMPENTLLYAQKRRNISGKTSRHLPENVSAFILKRLGIFFQGENAPFFFWSPSVSGNISTVTSHSFPPYFHHKDPDKNILLTFQKAQHPLSCHSVFPRMIFPAFFRGPSTFFPDYPILTPLILTE